MQRNSGIKGAYVDWTRFKYSTYRSLHGDSVDAVASMMEQLAKDGFLWRLSGMDTLSKGEMIILDGLLWQYRDEQVPESSDEKELLMDVMELLRWKIQNLQVSNMVER